MRTELQTCLFLSFGSTKRLLVSGRDLQDSLDGAALMGIGDRLVEHVETIERHEPIKREAPLTVEVDQRRDQRAAVGRAAERAHHCLTEQGAHVVHGEPCLCRRTAHQDERAHLAHRIGGLFYDFDAAGQKDMGHMC